MPVQNVAVVGAGIAGLTAALSLARHGISSTILEQAATLTAVGAGLQVSPNASHILAALGVLPALEARWLEPQQINLASGASLKTITGVPTGGFARQRWGAPYGVLHRATLQDALLQAVLNTPLCRLHLGCRYDDADGLTALCGGKPELIIGADGVWSKIRTRVHQPPVSHFSGSIAWRFVIPAAQAPAFLDRSNVTAFLGPGAHLVAYPLNKVDGFNIVAILSGVDPGQTWQAAAGRGERQKLLSGFAGWNPAIVRMLADAPDATVWPLYQAGPGSWQNGVDTVLIGDAAHAMLPFAAQGAAMAIEDGFELAALVATLPAPQAMRVFESQRKPRIERLVKRGAFNRFAYHARGPIRFGRDLVLSMRPPQRLAADLDWVYGYRSPI